MTLHCLIPLNFLVLLSKIEIFRRIFRSIRNIKAFFIQNKGYSGKSDKQDFISIQTKSQDLTHIKDRGNKSMKKKITSDYTRYQPLFQQSKNLLIRSFS